MGDHAVFRVAFCHRYAPGIGGGLDQHVPGNGATLTNILLATTNALTATGGKTAPHPVAREALTRRDVLGGHLGPVALQFLGHHLCQSGERALTHLGTRNTNDDRIIGFNHHPGVDLGYRG